MAGETVPWSSDASANHNAIQAALNEAIDKGTASAPYEVKLTSGKVYVVSGVLNIYSNTKLNLNGATIKRYSSADNISMLNTTYTVGGSSSGSGYTKASNITVTGGTWDSNGSKDGKILHFSHAQNITVSNATFKNCAADHVIIFDGVKTGKVYKCTFVNCTTHAGFNSSNRYANECIHIDATIARKSEESDSIQSTDKTPCNGITVDGCVFDGVCNAVGAHYHAGEGDVQQFNVTVTNNTFKKIESGSTCVTAYNIKGWTVKNNTAKSCGAGCFARLNGTKNFTIANNTVDNIDSFVIDNGNSGAKLTSNGTLSGNTVTNIKSNAFRASGIKSSYTLSGESYTTTRTNIPNGNADYAFIYVDTASATVKGCTFKYADGLNFSNGSGYIDTIKFVKGKFTIQNNRIYNAPYAGLYLQEATSGSSVTGNTIGYCGRKGTGTNSFTMILNNTSGCTVSGNTLKDCKQGGIYLNGASKNTIKNNTITTPAGKVDVRQYNSSGNTLSNNGPVFSGATRMPVQSTATYSISGGTLKSSNTGVVSVSGKTLTAKKTGTATITLTYNGRNYTKNVSVYAIHGKTYEMESSVNSNYVLDIQKGSTKNGAQMIVYKRNGGKNQKYQFYLQGDNTYCIRSLKSQKWLNVNTKDKKYVMQWSWTGGNNTKWKLTVDAYNRITFVNKAYNKCFDVQGGKTQNGSKMIIWTSNGELNQKWVLK